MLFNIIYTSICFCVHIRVNTSFFAKFSTILYTYIYICNHLQMCINASYYKSKHPYFS